MCDSSGILSTVSERYPQFELEQQFCFALYAACHAVTRTYRPLLADADLTYPQYLTLLALWEHPAPPHTVGAIGQRLRIETGTLTPILKRLELAGYISRDRDPDDERRVLLTVTDAGLALRDRLASVPEQLAACVGLDAAVAVRIRDELRDLVVALERSETTGLRACTREDQTSEEGNAA